MDSKLMRMLSRCIGYGLSITFLAIGSVSLQAAQPIPTDSRGRPLYQGGVVAVKLRSDTASVARKALPLRFGISSLDAISDELGVLRVAPMIRSRLSHARPGLPDLTRIYRITLPDAADVRQAAKLLTADPAVEYAEPIPAHYSNETPDDPDFSRQSFLSQIMAEAAWDVHKGEDGAAVVVGISDTGVAWRHEDLVENIHQNLGEDADGDGKVIEQSGGSWVFDPDDINGIDDDGNGYTDDFVGWNFLNDDRLQDNDPDDPGSHGTHVAGLAAGRTDNAIGISSISWNVKILPTSASNSDSGNSLERALSTVVYLAENGADVINMSWGGEGTSQYQRDVIEYARGLGSLLVSSAGNDSTSVAQYPSSLPGVVSVASVSGTDRLASYSNFGISIDISAPGGAGFNGLRSTVPPSNYGSKTGTSMASPVVAGVFALLKSVDPSWSNEQLVEQVLGTADSIDDVNVNFVGLLGEGRINAFRTLTDQPATSTPELRLDVADMKVIDDNGDGSVEAGEGAEILLTLRNYSHLAGSDAVNLTLHTEATFVDIVDATVTTGVTPDMAAEVGSTFSIQVAPDAPSGFVSFTLSAETSDATISPHSSLDLPRILIGGGGLLVWEGVADGPTFSGSYLRDELVSRGFSVTYISGEFPRGLTGFDGAFLSFGNAGLDPDGPPFSARLDTTWKIDAIKSYLESGGRVFLEGGDTLGYDIYNLVDGTALLPLFGLENAEDDGGTNSIDSLDGHGGALTGGMNFADSSQSSVDWIDIFTPSTGVVAFSESDYGVVAVQHRGQHGQRTFCFSYSLAELVDGSTTRGDLMDALVEFLGLVPGGGGEALRRRAGRRVMPAAVGKRLSPK
ncbi:MAG: S8 family serine peptidase [Thermoanaerobaculales bacterium]